MLILQLLLHSLTSHERRHELDTVFVIKFFGPSKFFPSYMDIVGLRIPTFKLKTFSCFVLIYHLNLSHLQIYQFGKFSAGMFVFRRQIITVIFDIIFSLHLKVYQ